MRSLPIDHCPSCGVLARGNTYCARCEVDMVDANGLPRVEPSRDEAASSLRPRNLALFMFVGWTVNMGFILLDPMTYRHQQFPARIIVSTAGTLVWTAIFFAIWGLFAVRRHLRLVRPWKLARRIGATEDGDVRVRGTVRTLVPSDVPDAAPSVAIRVGRRIESQHPLRTPGEWFVAVLESRFDPSRIAALLGRRIVVDSSLGGRFMVSDGTGVAVVDDDALEVFDVRPLHRRLLAPFETIEDGDVVDVLGPARRGMAADACILGGADPDHARAALLFDGRPDAKVRVLLRRTGARAAQSARAAESNSRGLAPARAFSR